MKTTASSIITLGLVGACTALPAPDKPTSSWMDSNGMEVVSYVAKFDDANAGVLDNLPVRSLEPLGPYDGLYYNIDNINVGTAVAGVKAQSSPHVLFFDSVSTTTQGTPAIYSDYDDSITDHFAFLSFYFGCVVTNAEDVASVPVACTVTATGFRNEVQVANQSIAFTPTGLVVSNMVKATLSSKFGNVDRVEFSADGLLTAAADAVLLDNFAYDVYVKKGDSISS